LKFVYLTIDDGPSKRTWQLLDYLDAHKVGAILFCIGKNLIKRPDIATRAIREGFIIGNHSYDHSDFNKLKQVHARRQVEKTDRIISELYARIGMQRPARYFRFPYGNRGRTARAKQSNQTILRDLEYWAPFHAPNLDWRWDVDVGDWHVHKQNRARKLSTAKKRLKALKPESILDLHDQAPNLQTHLFQELCKEVMRLGYTFHDNACFHEQAADHLK
jgi:peptidoglycan/xylan/chitin deacetylase (PgdA/CDA1 family)